MADGSDVPGHFCRSGCLRTFAGPLSLPLSLDGRLRVPVDFVDQRARVSSASIRRAGRPTGALREI